MPLSILPADHRVFLLTVRNRPWRYVNGPHLVALVRAGAKFEKGVLIERPDEAYMKVAA